MLLGSVAPPRATGGVHMWCMVCGGTPGSAAPRATGAELKWCVGGSKHTPDSLNPGISYQTPSTLESVTSVHPLYLVTLQSDLTRVTSHTCVLLPLSSPLPLPLPLPAAGAAGAAGTVVVVMRRKEHSREGGEKQPHPPSEGQEKPGLNTCRTSGKVRV